MIAYYNEKDRYAAQWLRNLIVRGHIAPGDVDERSIIDVRPDDLRGYAQCHFFAGIGGWSYALRLADWDDARPVWTGSCPCQPFSAAGQGKAADDERHLWPAWASLIRECRPGTIFGEQVEAAIGWGWLDIVFADLEAEGYACGATVLPACSVGAPHIRQRCWFVADTLSAGWSERGTVPRGGSVTSSSSVGELGNPSVQGLQGRIERGIGTNQRAIGEAGLAVSVGNATSDGQRQPRLAQEGERWSCAVGGSSSWGNCDWLPCTDGKARPVEPGTFPLAHGVPARVGKLRAYGNAIVPQVAAEFIKASYP